MGERKLLFFISLITIFISGLGANFENDLKKIIALSTLSQLGVMIMTLSLGYYELSFFHLLTHALFKSLLFLCAGVIIHGIGDIQDIRQLGGLRISLPVVSLFFTGASLALCGFPFISGFYSKDLILEIYFFSSINWLMLITLYFATIFTVTYSLRLIYILFFNNLGAKSFINLGEEVGMYLPIFILFIFSVISGSWIIWLFLPPFLVYISIYFKLLVLISIILITLFYIMSSYIKLDELHTSNRVKYFIGGIWFLPYLSVNYALGVLRKGNQLILDFDQGWVEKFGGIGSFNVIRLTSLSLDFNNNLNIKSYIILFFILTLLIFIIF